MCIILLCSTIVYAKHVIILKENKGPKGYKNVSETHENNNHVLVCKDPGDLKCKFENTTPPIVVGNSGNTYQVEYLENLVSQYIYNGQNTGRTILDGIVIVWDNSEQKSIIDIYDEESTAIFNNLH